MAASVDETAEQVPLRISRTNERLAWAFRCLLAAAVFCVFWPTLAGGFVEWDDNRNILHNPHLGFSLEKLRWMFTDCTYVQRYMPLGWLSYSIDHAIFGNSALSCHLGNLLVHAVNAILVFEIIRRLFAIRSVTAESSGAMVAAALGALWWALHPLRTEPVAWAAGRIYGVATLFFFSSICVYLGQGRRAQQARSVWVSALLFSCSLLTYPIALGGVAIVVLLDLFILERLPLEPRRWLGAEFRSIWLEKLLFLIPILITFGMNLWGRLHSASQPVVSYDEFSFSARVMQALWVFSWYVWKPWLPFHLAPRYPDLLSEPPFTPAHMAAALLVACITIALLLGRKGHPLLFMAWLGYLALVSPFIGFTEHPHHTFDRYSHIAGLIWAVLLAAVVVQVSAQQKLRTFAVGAGLAGCFLLGLLARAQTTIWSTKVNLIIAMAESLGNHRERAVHELLAASLLLDEHRPNEAEGRLRIALELRPGMAEGWAAMGDALAEQKRLDEAVSSFQHALSLKPQLEGARQKMGITLTQAARHDEAIAEFRKILVDNPNNAAAHRNIAVSLQRLGRSLEATQHMEEFRRLQLAGETSYGSVHP